MHTGARTNGGVELSIRDTWASSEGLVSSASIEALGTIKNSRNIQEVPPPDLSSVLPSNVTRPLWMSSSTLPLSGDALVRLGTVRVFALNWLLTTATIIDSASVNVSSTATVAPHLLAPIIPQEPLHSLPLVEGRFSPRWTVLSPYFLSSGP